MKVLSSFSLMSEKYLHTKSGSYNQNKKIKKLPKFIIHYLLFPDQNSYSFNKVKHIGTEATVPKRMNNTLSKGCQRHAQVI